MPTLIKSSFKAWIDKMPPGPHKLIVTGEIEVPTSGWTAELKIKSPQGINPDILMLDLVAQAPGGMVNQVISRLPLRFEQSPPARSYSQVTVLAGTDQVTVDVTTTH